MDGVNNMGKAQYTVYTCDRCKQEISKADGVFSFSKFHYMYVLKWYVPVGNYKLTYLCRECFEKLKQFCEGGEVG
jgi:hypothetical protein